MPQNPLLSYVAKNASNVGAPLLVTPQGLLLASEGGLLTVLNLTAPTVIKSTPARLARIIIIAPGSTSGAFTLNDCATTGAAAAANVIWTLPYNGTYNIAGQIYQPDWPCLTGLVLSAVPGAGSPIIAVAYA